MSMYFLFLSIKLNLLSFLLHVTPIAIYLNYYVGESDTLRQGPSPDWRPIIIAINFIKIKN